MKKIFLLILASCGLGLQPAQADPFIWVNVSYKFIRNPANGQIPTLMDTNRLQSWVDVANSWLAQSYRGYRLRVVDGFPQIGSGINSGSITNPSYFYDIDLKTPDVLTWFDSVARTNPAYLWNSNAVNIYVNTNDYSAAGFSQNGMAVIETSYRLFADPAVTNTPYWVAGNILHEMGHHFELFHTFAGACVTNDDCLSDTLLDNESWNTLDQLAQGNFASNYASLAPTNQAKIVDLVRNAMSYHQALATNTTITPASQWPLALNTFSEQQLDKWAEYANTSRRSEVSGYTIFVATNGSDIGDGHSKFAPYRSFLYSSSQANPTGGDVILLGPGNYNNRLTVSNPMTLRVARNTAASIGKP
jgi:hypothetical protein